MRISIAVVQQVNTSSIHWNAYQEFDESNFSLYNIEAAFRKSIVAIHFNQLMRILLAYISILNEEIFQRSKYDPSKTKYACMAYKCRNNNEYKI